MRYQCWFPQTKGLADGFFNTIGSSSCKCYKWCISHGSQATNPDPWVKQMGYYNFQLLIINCTIGLTIQNAVGLIHSNFCQLFLENRSRKQISPRWRYSSLRGHKHYTEIQNDLHLHGIVHFVLKLCTCVPKRKLPAATAANSTSHPTRTAVTPTSASCFT